MTDSYPLPFDALRPFKSRPEEFVPRDNLPWERLAQNLLKFDETPEEGFIFLSSAAVVEGRIEWLDQHLGLPSEVAILDIGCGPGLYSHRLAQLGYQVTGIDIADSFLQYGSQKAQPEDLPCRYLNLSMFEMTFEAQFEVVLLINSLARQLTLSELEILLTRVRKALKPGGYLIGEFSIAPPHFSYNKPLIDESIFLMNGSPWSTNFHAWMYRDLIFPSTSERVNHHLIVDLNGHSQEYWSRFSLYPQSVLTELLMRQGLQIKSIFGEKLGQAYQAGIDDYCFIWAIKELL